MTVIKHILFALFTVGIIAISFAQPGKENYFQYESENVEAFRDKIEFQLPEPTVIIKEEAENKLNPDSLSNFFLEGNKLHIQADNQLNVWIDRDKEIKKKITDIDGFRIQVYAGTKRANAFSVKGGLIGRFPDYTSYLEYKSPNYVVRIGDFMKREDAILFQKIIRESFPGAFIVPDVVKVPKYNPEWEQVYDAANDSLKNSTEAGNNFTLPDDRK
ncbi:MAG: SPOR domain-containing protein [Bacteroidota bacterium]